jgi:MOSC domain-containing protein YiiM
MVAKREGTTMTGSRTIRVKAVNIGAAEPIGTKSGTSGIFKRPQTVAVAVGRLGLAGDTIVDQDNHGGVDQAVYLFTEPEYDWWSAELGRDLPPGTFGENLVVSDLSSADLSAGDRLTFGDVVLQVTSPRIPCATLAARMDDAGFVKRFYASGRMGFYARVLSEGKVAAGAGGRYDPHPGVSVTMAEMVRNYLDRTPDPDFTARAVSAPIHYKLRARLLPLAAAT